MRDDNTRIILQSLKSTLKTYKCRVQYLRLEAGYTETQSYPYVAQSGFTGIHKRREKSKLRHELKRKSSELDEENPEVFEKRMKVDDEQ